MSSAPVISILDTSSNTQLSEEWSGFLEQDDVKSPVTPGSPALPSGAPPSLVCNSERFWGLEFSTAHNEDNFEITDYNVGKSILLSLPAVSNPSPPSLSTILGSFGLAQDGDSKWAAGGIIDSIIESLTDSAPVLALDTAEGARNAVWLTPGQTLRFDTALAFEIASSVKNPLDDISSAVLKEFQLKAPSPISSLKIFLQRTSYGSHSTGANDVLVWDVSSTFRLSFRLTFGNLWFWVIYQTTGVSFSITPNAEKQNTSEGLLSQLSALSIPGLSKTSVVPVLEGVLEHVSLLSLSAGKDTDSGIWWSAKLALTWGRSDPDVTPGTSTPVQIYFSYESEISTFSGGLITEGFYATAEDRFLPTYLPGTDIDQPADINVPASWDLLHLCGETDTLPVGLPTSLSLAEVNYTSGRPGSLSMRARLVYEKPPVASGTHYVPMPFTWDRIDIEMYKGAGFAFRAGTYFTLNAPPLSTIPPAHIGINISYDSVGPAYQLFGYVDNLSVGLLESFFDSDIRSSLLSTLGKLNIASLEILYTYKAGLASSFCFKGLVELGPIELRMFYQYTSKQAGTTTAAHKLMPSDGPAPRAVLTEKPEWFLEFDLGASSPDADIATIVGAISDDAVGSLPSFVGEIKIPTAAEGERSPISIKVAKQSSGSITRLLVVLRIVIREFTLTFIQVGRDTKQTKRLLRFSVNKIPLIDKVPLLDKLPQPFDQLEYYWVNGPEGFLKSEVEALNSTPGLLEGQDTLMYKAATGPVRDADTGSPAAGPVPDTIVIRSGHHFVVTHNNAVVIDHVFNATPAPPPQTTSTTLSVSNLSTSQATSPEPSVPTKGPVASKKGPLTISAVALQYKEQAGGGSKILSVVIDATFAMGPMSFSLLGFSIGIPLTGLSLDNLSDVAGKVVVNLNGLALSFNKPPILIAGGFEHQIVPDGEIYMGGLGLGFPPYTFVGIGEYKLLKNYKSVFIYAKLDGPIFTLEFATVEGVRLGFGYNSAVRSPDINQITSFPFINDHGTSGAGNDPMALLKTLVETPADKPWVSAKQDAIWFAAGMTIAAFDILLITAVAMFSFRDAGVVISLYADAIAQMPPEVKDPALMIIYVEIGMVAEVNFIDGYFRVEASLAPTSFLLVPQCRLHGGFALVYWFAPNNHAGDWVFTVGGYHKNYKPPAWYPVPKRLGISFDIGIIKVTGEAYFAVTPKVAMGGATMRASLRFGPINAWFDASMDALVNFHPLHYVVDFKCNVGVRYNLDVGLIHTHISASVGAWLHIEGPTLGGKARVDFYLFGFTFDFGATNKAPPPLDLLEFWEMLHKAGPPSTPSTAGADTNPFQGYLKFRQFDKTGTEFAQIGDKKFPKLVPEVGAALKFVLETGNCPMPATQKEATPATATATPPSTGAGAKWFVQGGNFSFRVVSDFAISHAEVNGPDDGEEVKTVLDATQSIYARPMRVSEPITSTLTVTIREKDAPFTVIGNWQYVKFAIKPVPLAAWGQYSRALDPIFTPNPSALLNGSSASTTPLPMGIMITAPPPELARSTIPVFKASAMGVFGIRDFRVDVTDGTDWNLAPTLPVQRKYLAAPLSDEENALIEANQLNDLWDAKQKAWQDAIARQDSTLDFPDGSTKTVNTVSLMIGQMTTLMGWDTKRPQTESVVSPPAWTLSAKAPTKLVRNLKNTYLALPRMAVVA